jgi:hypothetical protein
MEIMLASNASPIQMLAISQTFESIAFPVGVADDANAEESTKKLPRRH